MTEMANERVARALDLVPYILANPGISVSELALHFSVPQSQIVKDLSMLHMCGLPGYSHLELLDLNYEDPNFVEVTNPQVLDKPRKLSKTETMALVLGLQLLESFASSSEIRVKIENLRGKLIGVLGSKPQALTIISPSSMTPLLGEAQAAITAGKALEILYISRSSDDTRKRTVWPQSIEISHGYTYLLALDSHDGVLKSFRSDRILSLITLDSLGVPHKNVGNLLKKEERSVELHIGREALYFFENHPTLVSKIDTVEDGVVIEMALVDENWLLQNLVGLPGKIVVLTPLDFREKFTRFIQDTLDILL